MHLNFIEKVTKVTQDKVKKLQLNVAFLKISLTMYVLSVILNLSFLRCFFENLKLGGAKMQEKTLQTYLNRIVLFLRDKYEIDVQLVDTPLNIARQVAQWSNSRLVIDVRERGTMGTLFITCHVFGHLVQYTTTKKYSDILAVVNSRPLPLDLDEEFKKRYFIYEKEAFQIGKGLMEKVFEVDKELDRLYQIFMYADYEHFWEYLTTGHGSSRDEFKHRFEGMKRSLNKELKESLQSIDSPESLLLSGPIEIIVV